jgi:ribosomal protein S27AE
MAQSHKCPKCKSAMSEGFVMDNAYGTMAVSTWVEGAPKKSIWVGVKLEGRKPIEIETWRCGKCGFLESYAPPA